MQTTQTAVWETSQTAVSKLPFEWVYHSAVAVPNTPLVAFLGHSGSICRSINSFPFGLSPFPDSLCQTLSFTFFFSSYVFLGISGRVFLYFFTGPSAHPLVPPTLTKSYISFSSSQNSLRSSYLWVSFPLSFFPIHFHSVL